MASYKYITNKDFSTEFDSDKDEITVSLCVYHINTDCFLETTSVKDVNAYLNDDIQRPDFKLKKLLTSDGFAKTSFICPFLEFAMIDTNDQYRFPSFKFQRVEFTGKTVRKGTAKMDFEPDEDYIDYPYGNSTYFENECFLQLFKLFKYIPHALHLSNINDMYKGYIQTDVSHYTVMFDITEFLQINPSLLKPEYIFAILDEIMYKKKIWNTPIDATVTKLFKTHKKLRSLTDENDVEYPIPLQTYMCEKKKDQYVVRKNNIYPTVIEPFGLCYYMSNVHFDEKQDRFAMFVVNCLYNIELKEDSSILIANTKGKFNELTEEELSSALLTNSTYHFNDIDIQIWGIRDNLHFTKLK